VVSAGALAGEMGPIEHYAHAKAITGRAGLFPSRYQSDQVDRADGPLAHLRNARLREAWLRVADNLLKCNDYYRGKKKFWKNNPAEACLHRQRWLVNVLTRQLELFSKPPLADGIAVRAKVQ
jgi:hypothetical protein